MTFTRIRTIAAGVLAAIGATVLFHTSVARADGPGAIRMNFQKCFVAVEEEPFGGHYTGTVSGDLGEGNLIFTYVSAVPGDVFWRFSGIYTIQTPAATLAAFAAGIDNLRSGGGHDVLNGAVLGGDYLGAQVQVRAHDFNDGACSQGTITITPTR